MKTIKVIDLLNKIANGEEVPKKIKWGDHILTWCVYEHKALDELDDPNLFKCAGGTISRRLLNDEVEIIEDTPKEDKKIKRLTLDDWWEITSNEDCKPEMLAEIFNKNAKCFSKKINEIIDKVNGEDNE